VIDRDAQGTADRIAARLDQVSTEYERGWTGRPTQDHGLRFSRAVRGVEELRTLDGHVLRSGEARKLGSQTEVLQEVYSDTAKLIRVWAR